MLNCTITCHGNNGTFSDFKNALVAAKIKKRSVLILKPNEREITARSNSASETYAFEKWIWIGGIKNFHKSYYCKNNFIYLKITKQKNRRD